MVRRGSCRDEPLRTGALDEGEESQLGRDEVISLLEAAVPPPTESGSVLASKVSHWLIAWAS